MSQSMLTSIRSWCRNQIIVSEMGERLDHGIREGEERLGHGTRSDRGTSCRELAPFFMVLDMCHFE
jgi:hypothetical protein